MFLQVTNMDNKMIKTLITLLTLALTWRMGDTQGGDLCTRNAILKLHDEVYMSREVRHNIELDFTDFIAAMNRILSSQEGFIKEINGYDSEDDLRAKEPNRLIKFNNRINLIEINGTISGIMKKCVSLNSNVFAFDGPDEINLMKSVMKKLKLDKIAFVPFLTLTEMLGRESQRLIAERPAGLEATGLKKVLLGYFSIDGNFSLPQAVTEETASFCSKVANPFDSLDFDQFESRTWIKLVKKSISALKTFEKLYVEFRDNMNVLKTKEENGKKTEAKNVTWVVPAQMLRAEEFVTGHSHGEIGRAHV